MSTTPIQLDEKEQRRMGAMMRLLQRAVDQTDKTGDALEACEDLFRGNGIVDHPHLTSFTSELEDARGLATILRKRVKNMHQMMEMASGSTTAGT